MRAQCDASASESVLHTITITKSIAERSVAGAEQARIMSWISRLWDAWRSASGVPVRMVHVESNAEVARRSRSIDRSLTNKQTPSNGSVTRTERDLRVRRVATRLSDCRGQLAHGDRRVHYFHTGNMLAGRTSRHTVSPKLLTCVPHNISTAVINQSHPRPGRRTSPDPRQIPNTTSHIHPLRF